MPASRPSRTELRRVPAPIRSRHSPIPPGAKAGKRRAIGPGPKQLVGPAQTPAPARPYRRSESCTSGSALLEEIDELSRGRGSYIAANWLVGHALLRGRMHDELQHDFRSADRGRARRRNRRRRSLRAAFRRGHWRDPSGIARPSGHLLSRSAFDPGTASRLRPPVWRVADPRFRRARGGGSAHPRGPQGALRDTQFRWRLAHRCQYLERPSLGSVLYAREVPAVGGDTMFASQYLAYDALSDGMKAISAG